MRRESVKAVLLLGGVSIALYALAGVTYFGKLADKQAQDAKDARTASAAPRRTFTSVKPRRGGFGGPEKSLSERMRESATVSENLDDAAKKLAFKPKAPRGYDMKLIVVDDVITGYNGKFVETKPLEQRVLKLLLPGDIEIVEGAQPDFKDPEVWVDRALSQSDVWFMSRREIAGNPCVVWNGGTYDRPAEQTSGALQWVIPNSGITWVENEVGYSVLSCNHDYPYLMKIAEALMADR